MTVRILKTVPGMVHGRYAVVGQVIDLPSGLAISLIVDGYASAVGEAPAVSRETASVDTPVKRSPGRPKKPAAEKPEA